MPVSLVCTVLAAALLAQAQDDTPERTDKAEQESQLSQFKAKVAELEVFRGSDAKDAQPLMPEPILRYSNAETTFGSLDGAGYLWLDGKRPLVAASIWVRHSDNSLIREVTSFSKTPLECRTKDRVVWSPRTGGLLDQPLTDAKAPSEKKPQRLTQMREIAGRFTVTSYVEKTGQTYTLRLLPQPLYRFADEQAGILDGGLFAFVVSTDPDLLLLVEAVREPADREPHWRYSLARMCSRQGAVRLDDKEIWSTTNFYHDKPDARKTSPYFEGPVGKFEPSVRAEGDKE